MGEKSKKDPRGEREKDVRGRLRPVPDKQFSAPRTARNQIRKKAGGA